ncbi:protein DELAY OF GERMINATION 1-like [Typha latifolia]|uniref:protein DELAY OF GERMINATION 1-like n=1 Tax=Typha latifolia TaxID=4733 RepID=UPI003C2F4BF6
MSDGEYFAKFFEQWLSEQSRDLADLRGAAATAAGASDADGSQRHLVERVVGHYEYYYRAKEASARSNVLRMFSPTWTSSTENLFLWAGGWRPSAAFHLLYSKSGLQLEAQLDQILNGRAVEDLRDLSAAQLDQVDRLHRRTVACEKEIAEKVATVQETIAVVKMVEIAAHPRGGDDVAMEEEMEGKREGMRRLLAEADELRLATITGVVGILTSIQAVQFLIGVAELLLAVHEFGKRRDREESNTSG